jgi:hypothetical protein
MVAAGLACAGLLAFLFLPGQQPAKAEAGPLVVIKAEGLEEANVIAGQNWGHEISFPVDSGQTIRFRVDRITYKDPQKYRECFALFDRWYLRFDEGDVELPGASPASTVDEVDWTVPWEYNVPRYVLVAKFTFRCDAPR